MKLKIQFAALILALAGTAQAGNICVDAVCYATNASEDQAGLNARDDHNKRQCASVSLPASCTQAQHDAAGGSGTVYANTANGVRAYFLDRIKADLAQLVDHDAATQRENAKAAWQAADSTQKAAVCVSLGLSAQCR